MQDGGHLVSIEDEYEAALVATLPKLVEDLSELDETDSWLGLVASWSTESNRSETFQWSDGEPVKHTHWTYSQPYLRGLSPENPRFCTYQCNNDYCEGFWYTARNCSVPKAYMCKLTTRKPTVKSYADYDCPQVSDNATIRNWFKIDDSVPYCLSDPQTRPFGGMQQDEANDMCHQQGPGVHLPSFHSMHDLKVQLQFLRSKLMFTSVPKFWTGLTYDEDGWGYDDESSFDFTFFSSGYPKNETYDTDGEEEGCVTMDSNDGRWKTVNCDSRSYYYCMVGKVKVRDSSTRSASEAGLSGGIIALIVIVVMAAALIAIGGLAYYKKTHPTKSDGQSTFASVNGHMPNISWSHIRSSLQNGGNRPRVPSDTVKVEADF